MYNRFSKQPGTHRSMLWIAAVAAASGAVAGCSRHDAGNGEQAQATQGESKTPAAPPSNAPSAAANTAPAGPSPFCEAPRKLAVTPEACVACEQQRCDVEDKAGCTKYEAGSTDRARCEDVLTCIRSTNCIVQGNVNCYCGTSDVGSCKASASNANGECKARITAAFPKEFNSASIVDHINDQAFAPGAALALGQCDVDRCGELARSECIPYCK